MSKGIQATPRRSAASFFVAGVVPPPLTYWLTRSFVTPKSETDTASDEEANMELRMRLNVILAVASFVFLGAVVVGMI